MATPAFRSLLAKNQATENDVTNRIKKMIKDYDVLNKSVPVIKDEIKKAEGDEKKKLELQLSEAEDGLTLLDTDICEQVKKWLPQRQNIADRMNKMRKGLAAKKSPAAPAAPAPAPTPAPARQDPPPAPKPQQQQQGGTTTGGGTPPARQQDPPKPTPAPAQKSGGSSVGGWVGAVLAFVGGALLGGVASSYFTKKG